MRVSYGMTHDRIFAAHFPRHLIIGVNIVKKELRLQIIRPTIEEPLLILVHSRSSVMARGANIAGDVDLSAHCPGCSRKMIISKGDDAMKSRIVFNADSKYLGSHSNLKYLTVKWQSWLRKHRLLVTYSQLSYHTTNIQ